MDVKMLSEIPPWDWPEGTGTRLLRVLTDDGTEPSDRVLAAELAGDYVVVNDELARPSPRSVPASPGRSWPT